MSNLKSVHVPHLGGIDVAYQMPKPYDPKKVSPTLILVKSLTTPSELFHPQYANDKLTNAVNLLAIEPLGHGQTRMKSETWTFWDIAFMNVQVMEALGVNKAFAMGTCKGALSSCAWHYLTLRRSASTKQSSHHSFPPFLTIRQQIEGVIPLGTAMDYESPRTRDLGCWNGYEFGTGEANAWSQLAGRSDFAPNDDYCNAIADLGFGAKSCPKELRDFWAKELRKNYAGEEGWRRASMCVMNVAERDGASWETAICAGSEDPVFSVPNAEEEIKMFTGTPSAKLKVVDGGQHFLSGSHPKEVNQAALDFVAKFHKK